MINAFTSLREVGSDTYRCSVQQVQLHCVYPGGNRVRWISVELRKISIKHKSARACHPIMGGLVSLGRANNWDRAGQGKLSERACGGGMRVARWDVNYSDDRG